MSRVTQIEFARQQGWSRSYVTQLKAAGRLVMADGMVDVEASLALIDRTADPARDQVAGRHAKNRAAKAITLDAEGGCASGGKKIAPEPQNGAGKSTLEAEKVSDSYSKSRALKEFYAAQTAKAMYEKEVLGKLCDAADFDRAGAGLGAVLRTKLEGLSDRLAPVLAPVSTVEEIHALLVESHESILNEIANELERLAKAALKVGS